MKNQYAFNSAGELIHISATKKENKEKYTCCNCGNELITKKGKIKIHHFAHKFECNCNYESYLHKISKIKFFNDYNKCIVEKQPFYIEYRTKKTCKTCSEKYNISCSLDDDIRSYDLTQTFDSIFIEKSFNGFIADILLKSSKTKEVLFIEFAVTHRCEQKKINNGFRIIEFVLTDDSDLEFIDKRLIPIKSSTISFYNFKVQHKIADIFNVYDCRMLFDFYLVHKNNKTVKLTEQIRNMINVISSDNIEYFEIENTKFKDGDFQDFVIDYSFKNKKYKNCFACRFFAENSSYYSSNKYFCKRLKIGMSNSNFGINCDKFWRIEKNQIVKI